MSGGSRAKLTRRELLALIAGCGIGAGLAGADRFFAASTGRLDLDLPPADGLDSPTQEIFSALSCIVTAREQLSPQSVERLYAVFLDEPWGPQHILSAYRTLRAHLLESQSPGIIEELGGRGILGAGERWFCDHLLFAWYTGVYFHDQRKTQRLLFEDALMWEGSRDFVPAYFRASLPYGSWAQAPE